MIPESAGATPYGIFRLADDYFSAAKASYRDARIGPAPVRLLCLHAAELYLKTYMRSAGATVDSLKAMGHNLCEMVERSTSSGLRLPPEIAAQSRKLSSKNDYVRVRYMVIDLPGDISEEGALRFCHTIRSSIIRALNMDDEGVPQGDHWLGVIPPDYPVSRPVRD